MTALFAWLGNEYLAFHGTIVSSELGYHLKWEDISYKYPYIFHLSPLTTPISPTHQSRQSHHSPLAMLKPLYSNPTPHFSSMDIDDYGPPEYYGKCCVVVFFADYEL